ncbi:MAG: GIY-YIG nuclease family protein [Thalassotalea sp.]|nr:GIY-YIG nuclease family protein [Thalassotalea sp.]
MNIMKSDVLEGDVLEGNVYVMTHSIFSNVVRIGCTPNEPKEYAKTLSQHTPGDYSVAFQLFCKNPCHIKKQVRKYLSANKYVNEFYEVQPENAAKLLKTESLRISINHAY